MRAPFLAMLVAFCGVGVGVGVQAQNASSLPDHQNTLAYCDSAFPYIEQALTHPQLRRSAITIESARTELDISKQQYFPSLSVSNERSKNISAANAAPASSDINVRLQQTLWSGGRLAAGRELSEKKILLAQAGHAQTQYDIALNVIDAWTAWKASTSRYELLDQQLQRLKRLDDTIRRRVEQQVSAAVDGELMSLRLAQAQADLKIAQSSIQLASQKLVQSQGLLASAQPKPPAISPTASCTNASGSTITIAVDQVPAHSLDQHVSLMRNQAELTLAKAETEVKNRELWPSLVMRLERQFIDTGYSFGNSVGNKVFLGFQYTTSPGLTAFETIKLTQQKQASLEAERDNLRLDLTQRLQSELLENRTLTEKINSLAEVTRTHQQLLESYTRLFVAGRRSWLDVLNAARELSQSELSLSESRMQQLGLAHRLHLYAVKAPITP